MVEVIKDKYQSKLSIHNLYIVPVVQSNNPTTVSFLSPSVCARGISFVVHSLIHSYS